MLFETGLLAVTVRFATHARDGLSGSPMLRNAITAPICTLALLTGCGKPSSSSGGVGDLTLRSQLFAIYGQGKPLNNVYAIAGQAGTLEASGTGFTNSDVLEWNGNPLPTMVGDSTDIRGTVSAARLSGDQCRRALPGVHVHSYQLLNRRRKRQCDDLSRQDRFLKELLAACTPLPPAASNVEAAMPVRNIVLRNRSYHAR